MGWAATTSVDLLEHRATNERTLWGPVHRLLHQALSMLIALAAAVDESVQGRYDLRLPAWGTWLCQVQ